MWTGAQKPAVPTFHNHHKGSYARPRRVGSAPPGGRGARPSSDQFRAAPGDLVRASNVAGATTAPRRAEEEWLEHRRVQRRARCQELVDQHGRSQAKAFIVAAAQLVDHGCELVNHGWHIVRPTI